jgi:hypothetical protein
VAIGDRNRLMHCSNAVVDREWLVGVWGSVSLSFLVSYFTFSRWLPIPILPNAPIAEHTSRHISHRSGHMFSDEPWDVSISGST